MLLAEEVCAVEANEGALSLMLQQCRVERGEPIILAAILKSVCRFGPIIIPAHVKEAAEVEERTGPTRLLGCFKGE